MVGGQWCTATPRGTTRQPTGWHRADKTARQRIRLWLKVVRLANIPAITAADQTNDLEMAHDTPNAGLSDHSSGHPRRLWTSVNSQAAIRRSWAHHDRSLIAPDTSVQPTARSYGWTSNGRLVATYYRPNMSVTAIVRGPLAEVEQR